MVQKVHTSISILVYIHNKLLHVSVNNVASSRICSKVSNNESILHPSRWPYGWPQYIGVHCVCQLILICLPALLVPVLENVTYNQRTENSADYLINWETNRLLHISALLSKDFLTYRTSSVWWRHQLTMTIILSRKHGVQCPTIRANPDGAW